MLTRVLTLVVILFAVFSELQVCHAGLRREETWTAESPDGKLIFVMIPPISLSEEEEQGNTQIERSREIRSRFSHSGLYSVENGDDCLWDASFYLNDPGYVGVNGRHVVIPGAFAWTGSPSPEDVIAYFVEDGRITNSVVYKNVSPLWWLKRIIMGSWPECDDYGVDESGKTFWITTNLSEEIEFDFASGKVVRVRDPIGKSIVLAAFGLPVVGIGMMVRHLVRRKSCG